MESEALTGWALTVFGGTNDFYYFKAASERMPL